MASTTVEDYVKQIYLEQQRTGGAVAAMGKLATAMRVAPGTATAMVKNLAGSGLADYAPRTGVGLTEHGRQLALHVLRRHRLVELFLVETLNLDWTEVHEEAERLEHVISDRLLDRIDQHLGRPDVDPHGDPIPSAEGEVPTSDAISLELCKAGQQAEIVRIRDQTPNFLRFIERRGITPGTQVTVTETDADAQAMGLLLPDGRQITIGLTVAGKILFRPVGRPGPTTERR